jgi:hypothetical protein
MASRKAEEYKTGKQREWQAYRQTE